ncbi:MAG: AAA family ATPase [Candidatus Micrarchaeia archaeon]
MGLSSFIVAGTPGAGKTTVLSKVKMRNIKIVNFGDEMLKHANVQDRDKMRYLPAEKQNEISRKVVDALSRRKGTLVIDTHLSIKQGPMYLPGFSLKELKKLNVKGLLYIDADSKEIIKRREKDKTRKREVEDEAELNMQRSINLAIMASASAELDIPIYIFKNREGRADDVAKEVENTIKGLIK